MSGHILRTTVRLDPALLAGARQEARKRETTLTALIEKGLRTVMAESGLQPARKKTALPVSRESGGLLPGVNLNDRAGLSDLMDGL